MSGPRGDASGRGRGSVRDNAVDCRDGEQMACRILRTRDSGIALETFRNGFRDLTRLQGSGRHPRRFWRRSL